MYSQFPLPSSNTRYAISWPYLERPHVIVLVDGNPWPHAWLSDTEIQVDAGADGTLPGTKLEIVRVTPDLESYADIKDASNLDADQLNRLRRQLLYLLQERSGAIAGSLGNAINAIANDVGAISSGLDGVNQLIERLTAGLLTLDDLNASIEVAKNDAAAARASIIAEIAENDAEFAALRNRTLGLEAGAIELGARITSESTTRVTEDDALAQAITEMTAAMQSGDAALSAAVASAQLARTNADNALASSIESVRVTLQDADTALGARVDSEHTAWANADTALGARITAVDARVTTEKAALNASITSVDQARVSGDAALAARTTSLESKVDVAAGQTVAALINSEATARANADSANASALTTLQSTVGGHTTLQSTVGGHTTSIAQVTQQSSTNASRLGTVEAQTVLKTVARSDGKTAVAGIGLAATANGQAGVAQSELILMADRLLLTPPGDQNGAATPLMVAGTVNGVPTTIFPAARFGDQTIGAKVLIDGSVETRHLKVTGGGGASLWSDPNLQDNSAWQVAAWGTFPGFTTVADGISGNKTFRSATGTNSSMRGVRRVPLTAGKRYRISCYARRSADANGVLYLRVDVGTAETGSFDQLYAGGPNLITWSGSGEGQGVTTSWTRYSWEFVPSSANKFMSPMVLLNYNSSAGWMEAQDVRIEEMIDSSLVVQGGLSADRIDTRGLTIKDAAGNVVFAAGTPLSYTNVSGLGSLATQSSATWGQITGQPAGIFNSNITVSGGTLQGIGTGSGTIVANNATENGITHIMRPAGATLNFSTGTAGGALRIRLPQFFTSTMLRFFVEVFEYSADASVTYEIGGYCYAPDNTWYKGFARAVGNPTRVRPVRLGHDGARLCVWIGDPGSTWSYPQVQVTSFVAGYNNVAESLWSSGWSIAMDTSAATNVTFTEAVPKPGGAFSALNQITPDNASTYIANAAIGNAQIGGDLWSDNYASGSAGWIVRRNGNAEFNNVTVRGDVVANSVTANAINTANIQAGAVSSANGVKLGADVAGSTVNVEVAAMSFSLTADPNGFVFASATGRFGSFPTVSNSSVAHSWSVRLYIGGILQQTASVTIAVGGSSAGDLFSLCGFQAGLSGSVPVTLVIVRTAGGTSPNCSIKAGAVLYGVSNKR